MGRNSQKHRKTPQGGCCGSKIKGTRTGIDEALMAEEQIRPEKRDDWREVRNYVEAVSTAIAALKTLPLSNRLLKNTDAILMQGVRGEHMQPRGAPL